MSAEVLSTIELLAKKVKAKEDEANTLKEVINGLCAEVGVAPRYGSIAASSSDASSIRRDQFYGQTITGAARSYLEIRKAAGLGAASIEEIYKAVREGGYKFETKIEENAKTALRSALRKTSSVFHRVPTGDYGLLAWYPGAKAAKNEDEEDVRSTKKNRKPKKGAKAAKVEENGERKATSVHISNDQIRDVIFKYDGNYGAADIEKKLADTFPGKSIRNGAVSTLLYKLKEDGFIRIVTERQGKKGAQYCKT